MYINMNHWILGVRPRTLSAAVIPVVVGTAASDVTIIWWRAIFALIVAVFLQIATNFANDYSDGTRGVDGLERLGPPRLVGSGLATPQQVKSAAFIFFGLAAVFGGILSVVVNPWLLLFGIAAVAAGWFYTGGSHPYGYRGLGELSVFIFFGLGATLGSSYLQSEEITGLSLLVAISVGLMSCSLLEINNLRDREGDEKSGKKTLAVLLGDRGARILYIFFIDASLIVGSLAAFSKPWAFLILIAGLVAFPAVRSVLDGASGKELIPLLSRTSQIQMVAGVFLPLGLLI
ncbi:MAG TPA: 1,4-dihydroxy-2-naphthoate polyprenyltransferase [Acidimicrobiales bacterium]|nr:1,4-dihydroxy-2-naphthoate polyprenyltransferase [Acidimicrobiales bacterium]